MGLENPVHLIFIGILALLVLGPRRLPELARALGHGMREFREAMSLESREQPQPQPQAVAATPPQGDPLAAGLGGTQPTAALATTRAEPAEPSQPAAPAPPEAVDPGQPIRSADAPDRGPL
jgi:TatA/E family protein of Tat protein translocase